MDGLVENDVQGALQDDGTRDPNTLETIKAVKYSILYMKAVKALQEAMTRIETLENQSSGTGGRIMAVSRINEAGLNINQYGNRNVIINGAMQVAQRSTSETAVGGNSGYYVCDRWRIATNTSGRVTISQDSDAPQGFGNSTKLACTTADTSISF